MTKAERIDLKMVAKKELTKEVKEFLTGKGLQVLDGATFGYAQGTMIIRGSVCDIQIKVITLKSKIFQYTELK